MQSFKFQERLVFLDWLRIIAFLTVFIGHKFQNLIVILMSDPKLHGTIGLLSGLLFPVTVGGACGVVIFFLVSGYIITHVLFKESSGDFLLKRFFRIYPLFFVAVFSQVAFNKIMTPSFSIDWAIVVKQLTLFGDFSNTPNSLTGVDWTLRVEILFYIVMSLIKKSGFLDTSNKLLLLPLISLILYSLWSMKIIPFLGNWNQGYLNLYAPFLFMGSLVCLFEKGKLTTTVLIMFTSIILIQHWSHLSSIQPGWKNEHYALIATMIFFVFWLFRYQLTLPSWALFLSKLTYSFYLFHNWVYDALLQFFTPIFQTPLPSISLSIISLIGICWLSVVCIEQPSLKLGRKFIRNLSKTKKDIFFKTWNSFPLFNGRLTIHTYK